ncbi:hypothetical protein KFK09_025511 [Dendrobium nobile]|uniref:DUF4283 domain-containing protein n=1 Tax=Dendrobium nobile TaxID=94219 RepID=A0A8T3AH54_DENNO|nr:hypothetical protein KFK09_025511 [Dendrobium nobile]
MPPSALLGFRFRACSLAEEIRALAKPFEFALVGRFPGRRPTVDAIRKFCFNLKLIGDFSVTVLNARNVLIKLVNDFDYCRIFAHRSYFVQNCLMKVVKWSPHLDVEVDSPVVPIWVSFPLLRPHLFSPRILFGLGSIFGKPLKSDLATASGSRPSVARILVEMDVTVKHADKVWVGSVESGYVQSVIFDDIPKFCVHCNSLGHSKGSCTILHSNLVTSKPTIDLGGVPVPTVSAEVEDVVNNNVVIVPNVVGLNNDVAAPCGELSPNPHVDLTLEIVQDGNVLCEVGCMGVAENLLSPNALPFVPSSDVSRLLAEKVVCDNLAENVVSPKTNLVVCEKLVSNPNGVDDGLPGDSAVLGNEEVSESRKVQSAVGDQVLGNFINVPVNLSAANIVVGSNSGMEVRSHGDWLNNSSEVDSDSESFSDPNFDFKMVPDRSIKASVRGKLWKRGGRRR